MSSMENPPKVRRVRKSTQSGAGANSQRSNRGHGTSSKPSGKGKKLPFLQDTCYRCGKGADTKRYRTAKLWMQHAGAVERKDTMKRCVPQETFHTLTRSSTGFHQHCRGRGW